MDQRMRRGPFIFGVIILLSIGSMLLFISAPGKRNPNTVQSPMPSTRIAFEAPCVYPDGRILIIEKRLEPIKAVEPKYPEAARLLHVEGHVQVTALVDQNGNVVWACGKGPTELISAAEETAREYKFAKTGIPGRTPVVLNFDFRLDDRAAAGPQELTLDSRGAGRAKHINTGPPKQYVRNCDFTRFHPLRPVPGWSMPNGIAKRVVPKYPVEAKRRRLGGRLPVRVLIRANGEVEQACGTGEPILRKAAEEAALQFIFRTPETNGKKVPYVQETIICNFVLDGEKDPDSAK